MSTTLTARADDATTSADDEVTIEEIVAAWNARHDSVQTLHFAYTEETIKVRMNNLRLHRDRELFIDGIRFHNEGRGDILQDAGGAPQEHFIQVYDGTLLTNFFGYQERSDRVHPCGYIHRTDIEGYQSEGHFHELWPIFHTFRIRQPAYLTPTADVWRLKAHTGRIDGRDCAIVEYLPEVEQGRVYDLWVDPSRDFVALRKSTRHHQIDIEYEQDAVVGWYPCRWVVNQYGGGETPQLRETIIYAVTSHDINQPVDESLLDYTPPPGTEVKDYSDEAHYSHYLITDHGRRRDITEEELRRGSNYTDWLATESGRALLPPESNTWKWVVGGVVSAVAGGWLFRRLRIDWEPS
jgi:hypothetical protein